MNEKMRQIFGFFFKSFWSFLNRVNKSVFLEKDVKYP